MKQQALEWREVSRQDLAAHLQGAEIVHSRALGSSSLYHCRNVDGDTIAVALPDGAGLVIGVVRPHNPALERRRQRGENLPLDE